MVLCWQYWGDGFVVVLFVNCYVVFRVLFFFHLVIVKLVLNSMGFRHFWERVPNSCLSPVHFVAALLCLLKLEEINPINPGARKKGHWQTV